MNDLDQLIAEIERDFSGKTAIVEKKDVGTVTEIKDEVVFLSGLDNVAFGEIVEFSSGVTGMVIDLSETSVGVIVFGDYKTIVQGSQAKATGNILTIPVGSQYLGRIVDGLGNPLDGKGKIVSKETAFIDSIAPGVIDRQSVDTPLHTGIKAIDGLIPIGRGQRELIIGDRRSGKTTIAIDTILNQADENVICIYNIIGQRQGNAASLIDLLTKKDALKYTIIVAATASDPASLQYISPYTATTIAEYFAKKGKDVLIIYDDLSKHAWAYRQISLILRRPAGREAYPGDVFYLHSRLLERACRLSNKLGGGSITALPIIETQEGDISAYIPTNVISITDGQIILDSDLFNSGIRPAINIGGSVSRVGGAAQTKAMKQVAGRLKLELAQYRELAAFAQFESDLDTKTKQQIDRGSRLVQILRQDKHATLPLSIQVILFWIATKGYLDKINVKEINQIQIKMVDYLTTTQRKLLNLISQKKEIDQEIEGKLTELADKFFSSQIDIETN